MTATIEPRLIHLLNESTTPQISSTDLPPIAQPPYSRPSDLPLPPIDSDTSFRNERSAGDGQLLLNSAASVSFISDDFGLTVARDEATRKGAASTRSHDLQFLLSDNDHLEAQTSSLSNTVDDTPHIVDESSNKKRTRGLPVKDDFMQLPQPVKKQKAAPQAHVMPPIINGLHEPPPHAALFPPISSSSDFPESDTSKLSFLQDLGRTGEERHQQSSDQSGREEAISSDKLESDDKNPSQPKKRASRPRCRWTEEETRNLLLGVSKHGVGKWKNILVDPEYYFNSRSAGDLKDRFRTCCPDELRSSKKAAPSKSGVAQPGVSKTAIKKGRDLDKILINVAEVYDADQGNEALGADAQSSPAAPKKSRTHRKKMKDLAEIGILGPFRPSGRRERRPFTDEEDQNILKGLEQYGPAWTKIQRDPRFGLANRQPTDLRDRVRNGYPAVYQAIEKGTYQTKGKLRSNDIMEPSVITSIGHGFERPTATETQSSKAMAREEMPKWHLQLTDNMDAVPLSPQQLEFGDGASQTMIGGEMDISRLLLDEPRMT
ncbi:myb-like DNA-binding domain-containing protein [Sarocladium implicatum]|nr:myb-like DNA-binding domain-containing protein [Sarocladium implicatum]